MKNFKFCPRIPKGKQPVESNAKQLAVFEDTIPFWGNLQSYNATFFRDGERVWDMYTYSVGVKTEPNGDLTLKFQVWDKCVESVVDHEYSLQADFYLCET